MPRPDFGGEPAYYYLRTVRNAMRAGAYDRLPRRPAMNAAQRDSAQQVQRELTRLVVAVATGRGDDALASGGAQVCSRCGALDTTLRLWRQIWPASGGPVALFCCADGCPSGDAARGDEGCNG